ncbi:sulfotransferase family protein [Marivirga arenosa]|uniref:Sulfotransferase n=1 Tax=Marivirga arenosa TaxID=3059076 RepID=A0AA51ZV04_9BACT|nr:sulfotransferase [Marivirga sp. BKB1-2]WNB16857.1 sulfotransferase [Marivirga sp. BKB1-2]
MVDLTRFFILGNPRSGTSLFRLMLNMHPNIVVPPESGFLHWWSTKYNNWSQSDNTSRIDEYLEDLMSSKKFETWGVDKKKLKYYLISNRPKNYLELTSLVYLFYKGDERVKLVGDKNNYYVSHINDLLKIWPDAFFLHIVRDVRDVYSSYKDLNELQTTSAYKPELSTNPEDVVKEWLANNENIESLSSSFPDRYYLIKYEDIISDPLKTLSALCDFLGIKFSDEMLNYHLKEGKKFIEPEGTLDWKKKTRDKLDTNNIGRYKRSLSGSVINLIEELSMQKLKAYGYEKS